MSYSNTSCKEKSKENEHQNEEQYPGAPTPENFVQKDLNTAISDSSKQSHPSQNDRQRSEQIGSLKRIENGGKRLVAYQKDRYFVTVP